MWETRITAGNSLIYLESHTFQMSFVVGDNQAFVQQSEDNPNHWEWLQNSEKRILTQAALVRRLAKNQWYTAGLAREHPLVPLICQRIKEKSERRYKKRSNQFDTIFELGATWLTKGYDFGPWYVHPYLIRPSDVILTSGTNRLIETTFGFKEDTGIELKPQVLDWDPPPLPSPICRIIARFLLRYQLTVADCAPLIRRVINDEHTYFRFRAGRDGIMVNVRRATSCSRY